MANHIEETAIVPSSLARSRFDRAAADLFPEFSRARLQQWIASGELLLGGVVQPPKCKVNTGDVMTLNAIPEVIRYEPQDIPFDIEYEDDSIIIVNKRAGLVVHPGAGNKDGTLLNGLLHHCAELETIPRAGIVHRLDKDTTGLMVVAKTLQAQNHLVTELQDRNVSRIYEALTYGVLIRPGKVEAALGRHQTQRTKMSVRLDGKPATTHYKCLLPFNRYSHLELSLETGRTHQIRVHMQHLGFPLIGDPTYGGHFRSPPGQELQELEAALLNFPRQALHARKLSFVHPQSNDLINFEVPLAQDMSELLGLLKLHASAA